jgi:hypothetical protein
MFNSARARPGDWRRQPLPAIAIPVATPLTLPRAMFLEAQRFFWKCVVREVIFLGR